MSDVMMQLPDSDPRMKAWRLYKSSPDYKNSHRWAAHEEHRDGSMWAAFEAGWRASQNYESADRAEPETRQPKE